MKRALLLLAVASLSWAAEPRLDRSAEALRFTNDQVTLTFDAHTGRLTAYGPIGGAAHVATSRAEVDLDGRKWDAAALPRLTASDLRVEPAQPGRWIVGAPGDASPGGSVVTLTSTVGDWQLAESWRLWPESTVAVRTAAWTWRGTGPAKVRSARLCLDGCRCGTPATAEVVLPRTFPVPVLPVRGFQPGRRHGFDGGAVTNRLVVVRDSAARQAFVTMTCAEAEHGWGIVTERAGAVDVQHEFPAQLDLPAGGTFAIGAQLLGLSGAETAQVVERAWEMFDRAGLRTCAKPDPVLDAGAIYSAHPGGTIGSGFRDCGGFREFTKRLPGIKALGFTVVWLLPFWQGPVYAPVDYTKLDPAQGTEADLKALIAEAHRLGLKVVGDLVPHGPREEGGLKQQHPEWITRYPDGSVFYMWGCFQCDYAHPGWQQYMAEHAVDWMRRVGLDGYRVDCAAGGPPNWRPAPGLRPSMSSEYGARTLLAVVREAMLKVNPQALLIMEGTTPELAESGDVVYDFPWAYDVLPKSLSMPGDVWRQAATDWLTWQQAWYPRGTRFMRYAESHDMNHAAWRYGPRRHDELLALNCRVNGVPLVYDREEEGCAQLAGDLAARRKAPQMVAVAPALAAAHRPTVTSTAAAVVVDTGRYRLDLDPQRGLAVRSFGALSDGRLREGQRKLAIGQPPLDFDAAGVTPQVRPDGDQTVVEAEWTLGQPAAFRLHRTYHCAATTVRVDTTVTLLAADVERVSSILTQTFTRPVDQPWRVETLDGILAAERTEPRLAVTAGGRYRHADSAVLWDSNVLPLAGDVSCGQTALRAVTAEPADWLQGIRLTATGLELRWLGGAPVTLQRGQTVRWSFTLAAESASPPPAGDPRLAANGSNYVFENQHYRLVLGRSDGGGIRELRRRTAAGAGAGPNLFAGLNTYTDVGIYGDWHDPAGQPHRDNARSRGDLEPDVTVRREGTKLILGFTGTFRGSYGDGLDVQRPYSWYRHEYVLDDSPVIRLRLGFRPHSSLPPGELKAFAAHYTDLPAATAWRAAGVDGVAQQPAKSTSRDRVWQSKQHGGLAPGGFRFTDAGGWLDVQVTGGEALQNAFLCDNGGQLALFLAPFDLEPATVTPRWYETEVALEVGP